MPSQDRGLLARLDALIALVADRHGLTLLPDSRLVAAYTGWTAVLDASA